jgi:hypothetical protein
VAVAKPAKAVGAGMVLLPDPAPTGQRRHVVVTSMATGRLNRTFNALFYLGVCGNSGGSRRRRCRAGFLDGPGRRRVFPRRAPFANGSTRRPAQTASLELATAALLSLPQRPQLGPRLSVLCCHHPPDLRLSPTVSSKPFYTLYIEEDSILYCSSSVL